MAHKAVLGLSTPSTCTRAAMACAQFQEHVVACGHTDLRHALADQAHSFVQCKNVAVACTTSPKRAARLSG
eukprot:1161769-Pelagomonas_calceolata.AAC.4